MTAAGGAAGGAGGAGAVAVDAAVRAARAVRWFVRGLMGDDAYATYVAHHERTHPGEPLLDERAFWRERSDAQDRNPGSRCC